MKNCKTCIYNISPAHVKCDNCSKETFNNYTFKANCFGKYDFRLNDCQRQDNITCVECKYKIEIKKYANQVIELQDKLHRRNMQIKELKEAIKILKLQQESLILKNNKLSNYETNSEFLTKAPKGMFTE